jgi:hypothetical protein
MLVCVFLCTLHTRPRVQRAPGLPCALYLLEGHEFEQTSDAMRREIAKARSTVIASHPVDAQARHMPGSGGRLVLPELEVRRGGPEAAVSKGGTTTIGLGEFQGREPGPRVP